MTYILGLNLIHDTSAALIKDDQIIGAVEEERFNRQKHTSNLPTNAIKWLLSLGNISLEDIDYIVTSFNFNLFEKNPYPFELNIINHDDATHEGRKLIELDNRLLYLNIRRKLEKIGIKNG